MIVSVVYYNNKTTQQQIAETNIYYYCKIKIVNLPSSYNEYYSRVWLPHQYEKTTMTIVNMCQVRDENTDYLTRHHAHCARSTYKRTETSPKKFIQKQLTLNILLLLIIIVLIIIGVMKSSRGPKKANQCCSRPAGANSH